MQRLVELEDGLVEGIVACECYEYPVLAGIPVLRQISPVSSIRNEAVEYLRRSNSRAALRWLLEFATPGGAPGLRRRRSRERLSGLLHRALRHARIDRVAEPLPISKGFAPSLLAARTASYARYLYHRPANPSFLGVLVPLVVLGSGVRQTQRRRFVDLLSGAGHASAAMAGFYPELDLVLADGDFVNLFLAMTFIAPGASAVCIDAEVPLPFRDGGVDGLLCLDGLHYVRSKRALLREVDRVVSRSGFWLFAHMHNRLAQNVNPGAPLSPQQYAEHFSFSECRLLGEAEILTQLQADDAIDLTHQGSVDALTSFNALTAFGARNNSLWTRHTGITARLCRPPDRLAFNPIYEVSPDGADVVLRARWPSEALRAECATSTFALPDNLRVPAHLADELATLLPGQMPSPELQALVRRFVVMPLPRGYQRLGVNSARSAGGAVASPPL